MAYEALLFMCAGVIIHTIKDSQDIRFMGGLLFQIPFTSVCLGVSSFALCGIPFLAGLYSKDFILEIVSFSYIKLVAFVSFLCFYCFDCLLFISFNLLCFL
jgi:NADH-ubiquinone oxidoreductase chain 5